MLIMTSQLFNYPSDITKIFCCCFDASEGEVFLFIFLPNWLADELACQQICSVEIVYYQIGPTKLSCT